MPMHLAQGPPEPGSPYEKSRKIARTLYLFTEAGTPRRFSGKAIYLLSYSVFRDLPEVFICFPKPNQKPLPLVFL